MVGDPGPGADPTPAGGGGLGWTQGLGGSTVEQQPVAVPAEAAVHCVCLQPTPSCGASSSLRGHVCGERGGVVSLSPWVLHCVLFWWVLPGSLRARASFPTTTSGTSHEQDLGLQCRGLVVGWEGLVHGPKSSHNAACASCACTGPGAGVNSYVSEPRCLSFSVRTRIATYDDSGLCLHSFPHVRTAVSDVGCSVLGLS